MVHEGSLEESIRQLVASGRVEDAATTVLRAYGPEVNGFLGGVLGDGDSADDVFSLVSERIWHGIGQFQWRCSLRTWVYVIARREVARFRDGARRNRVVRAETSQLDKVIAYVRTQTQSALGSDKQALLAELRAGLSEDDRTILILKVNRGMTWDDVALAFVEDPDTCSREERRREADRLKQRFRVIKQDLERRAKRRALRRGPAPPKPPPDSPSV